MKKLLFAALLAATATVQAAGGTEAFRDELENTLTASYADSWARKRLAERTEDMGRADAFVKQAERLFGTAMNRPSSVCRQAAIYRKFYIQGLNDVALTLEGRPVRHPTDLLVPMNQAVDFGQAAGRCLGYLDGKDRGHS